MNDGQTWEQHVQMEQAEQVAARYLQMAGLHPLRGDNFDDPIQFRRMVARTLSDALPATADKTARTHVSQYVAEAAPQTFAKLEKLIYSETEKAAHQSPTLRTVITKDRTGREMSEYFGQKSSWMNSFKAPAFEMIGVSGHEYP
jgi:hypothetical protein